MIQRKVEKNGKANDKKTGQCVRQFYAVVQAKAMAEVFQRGY